MKLVWKLLRRHISLPQLAGFFFANLLGMLIVMLSLQFYSDVKPLITAEDGFIRPDYLILNKRISALSSVGLGSSTSFSGQEMDELRRQPFAKSVGQFTSSQYRVACSMGLEGVAQFGTEMFFESVPDAFVDVDLKDWHFHEGDQVVPIILPRTYLAIYNFGFAQSQNLPKISEGIVGMIDMVISMRGNGLDERMKGRVIGFSNRLNTILVPEDFIRWSNARYAPDADEAPTRIILEVRNPTDDAIAKYVSQKGYELEGDKLEAGRATYFLRVVTMLVMCIGLLISLLSFYILMLSIYLLVQKNTEKLQGLLLIGYSPARVSLPYQILTVGMNGIVLILSFAILSIVRGYYMDRLWTMFPQMKDGSMALSLCLGLALFLMVSIINIIAIRGRIMKIWNNKD